jgi:hypothetical protein
MCHNGALIETAPTENAMEDDPFHIPDFLVLTPEQRAAGWRRCPPKSLPAFGREVNETQIAYRQSIEDEKALKRVLDEQRFRIMREKAAAEKAELEGVREAARRASKKYR